MFNTLQSKFSELLGKIGPKKVISEKNIQDTLEEIKIALLEADVNVRVVRRFINSAMSEAKGERVLRSLKPGEQFVKIVHDRLLALLGDENPSLNLRGPDTQSVILLAGLQGSGKTTTAAKLARHLQKEGRRVQLVAADITRPAAAEQLRILGQGISVPVYINQTAKNPIKIAQEALKEARKNQYDTIIVDSSGRMASDSALMKELHSLQKSLKPTQTLLVADAMTGQHAVSIAKDFAETINISGIILSKFDSDTRGGAALSIKTITGAAIQFIGTGEKLDDLEPFIPERMVNRILGMGDIVSLVEKTQEHISAEENEKLQKKIAKKSFTLEDYLEQFRQMKKMGGIEKILDFLPAFQGTMDISEEQRKKIDYQEAIILSMTRKERQNHLIIGPSRRKRIALGSGRTVHEVNKMLKEFEKTRLMMKKAVKNKKYQQNLMQQLGY